MNTCTIGTASNKAGAALPMVLSDCLTPCMYCWPFMRKMAIHARDTRIRIAPGENNSCAEVEIPVPNRASTLIVAEGPVNQAFTAGTVRVRISSSTTST